MADIMTTERWLDIINNNGEETDHLLSLRLAAMRGTKRQLEHFFTAYPNLREAMAIKDNAGKTPVDEVQFYSVNGNNNGKKELSEK